VHTHNKYKRWFTLLCILITDINVDFHSTMYVLFLVGLVCLCLSWFTQITGVISLHNDSFPRLILPPLSIILQKCFPNPLYIYYITDQNYCVLPEVYFFFPGTLVSSTNKTDHHDITEILLEVALNTITLTLMFWINYSVPLHNVNLRITLSLTDFLELRFHDMCGIFGLAATVISSYVVAVYIVQVFVQ
jgi:hypothetical protein